MPKKEVPTELVNEKNDLDKMIKDEVEEQITNPNKFDLLSNDSTSKYYIIPTMVKDWVAGKKLTDFPLNEISSEVIIFFLRKIRKIDEKRLKKEVLMIKVIFGDEFFASLCRLIYS